MYSTFQRAIWMYYYMLLLHIESHFAPYSAVIFTLFECKVIIDRRDNLRFWLLVIWLQRHVCVLKETDFSTDQQVEHKKIPARQNIRETLAPFFNNNGNIMPKETNDRQSNDDAKMGPARPVIESFKTKLLRRCQRCPDLI